MMPNLEKKLSIGFLGSYSHAGLHHVQREELDSQTEEELDSQTEEEIDSQTEPPLSKEEEAPQ